MSEIRLQVRNITKHFGINRALNNVSFDIKKGSVHALIGENGSGKSTLTNMLTGIYQLESGTFTLDGENIHAKNQVDANNHGISIIVQELGTLSGLSVAENIFLGHEERFITCGFRNTKRMNDEANRLLKEYGFDHIKANVLVDEYNFEDRKLIEIVKATYFKPKIVVIDETTTALSQEGREELYKHMKRIKEEGNTVIFISHDLPEILDKADTITVLRDGDYIDTVQSKDVTEDDLKKLMVGREVTGDYYRNDYGTPISDEVVLSVKNVTVPKLIHDVSFDLHKGEILGFGGLSESGMHEIGKAIFGASFDREGEVVLANGTHINDIPTAIKNSIAYTSKDRDNESAVMNQSIKDNIALPSLDNLTIGKTKLLSLSKIKDFALKFAKEMSVKMVNTDQFVSELSGGNKQKVVLSRWIGKGSDIVVLDSPTRGIDIKVKQDIYQLMDRMRKEGKSIIMISEELMELIGMCDRIIIMKDGAIKGELPRSKELNENSLISMMV
ncbi:MAG: sugar ABC transporter ATP-binding protein [Succinivibrio sp.]|nr:sugar ABC transporter ATP-binding protein [Succinivibrio sp.]MCI6449840.1 sugar ABC transporter ATP-binding protein [Succinivibrio sp.]MCI7772325.1 sugar ABC transporter ATP-binding protein [Succinivibrio sp.]MCI7784503.1 sugar ABC transporter ATP-binding protein [Succinivibrio sp.]MDD6068827.1 sugar ABC transporter ATP-binding protein [Succinivibrio sp.]